MATAVFGTAVSGTARPAPAAPSPETLLLLAYDGTAWYPYTASVQGNRTKDWRKIEAVSDPIEVTYQSSSGTLFYKSDNGELIGLDLATGTERSARYCGNQDPPAYSQLRAHEGGVALVELEGGKSRETTLAVLGHEELFPSEQGNCSSPTGERPFIQSSAQFHPFVLGQVIYYAHVSCRGACDPIVQDVWRFDRVTGRAAQLTRLNATTYLHSLDEQRGHAYLSSNAHGYYHIARVDLDSDRLTWLTTGQVTDSHPSVSRNGDIYFIRRDQLGSRLMRVSADSDPVPLELPSDIRKLRYLEVSGND